MFSNRARAVVGTNRLELATRRFLSECRLTPRKRNNVWAVPRRTETTMATPKEAAADLSSSAAVEAPSRQQLFRVFSQAAVPMIGFGIMDQTIMIQAGNYIDCTIGVAFGLSTLSAAAFGQICSDASGVVFGGTVERLATAAGLPSPQLSAAQSRLPIVARAAWAGSFLGIILGCVIGLVNLFFIDTSRSSTLKLQAVNDGEDFDFSVQASNAIRPDVTVLTVEGPDVDGLLASMTYALEKQRCSVVEMSAKQKTNDEDSNEDTTKPSVMDVFYVVDRDTGEPFEDEELEVVAQALLESTRAPLKSIKAIQSAAAHEQTKTAQEKSVHEKLNRLSMVNRSAGETEHRLRSRISVVTNPTDAPKSE